MIFWLVSHTVSFSSVSVLLMKRLYGPVIRLYFLHLLFHLSFRHATYSGSELRPMSCLHQFLQSSAGTFIICSAFPPKFPNLLRGYAICIFIWRYNCQQPLHHLYTATTPRHPLSSFIKSSFRPAFQPSR